VLVNVVRAVVIAALAVAVATGVVTVLLIYAALVVIGSMETLADSASTALLPALVPAEHLPRANARLMGVQIVGNGLLAPPLGAALFVVAAALPFGLNAATFLVAALLVATLRGSVPREVPTGAPRPMIRDIATGVRALMGHRVLRVLALCLCLMNVVLTGAFSILVLYARERLGLDEIGFGLLLAASAVGGLAGSVAAARLLTLFGAAFLLRVGLVIETCTHLSLALTRAPWVAVTTMVVFGAHASLWGVITLSWRQRVVPDALRGRVNSVYFLFAVGGSAIGALTGGLAARGLGITAPFWIAFAGMAALTLVAWRLFTPARLDDPDPVPLVAT
jgi:predicted MFS family arabinose efflux permease